MLNFGQGTTHLVLNVTNNNNVVQYWEEAGKVMTIYLDMTVCNMKPSLRRPTLLGFNHSHQRADQKVMSSVVTHFDKKLKYHNKMVESSIIMPVTEFTEWSSPMVAVHPCVWFQHSTLLQLDCS